VSIRIENVDDEHGCVAHRGCIPDHRRVDT
jgi:hypothetical protein